LSALFRRNSLLVSFTAANQNVPLMSGSTARSASLTPGKRALTFA
jgi:hypothetical protein